MTPRLHQDFRQQTTLRLPTHRLDRGTEQQGLGDTRPATCSTEKITSASKGPTKGSAHARKNVEACRLQSCGSRKPTTNSHENDGYEHPFQQIWKSLTNVRMHMCVTCHVSLMLIQWLRCDLQAHRRLSNNCCATN
jgi:hypothetical protein